MWKWLPLVVCACNAPAAPRAPSTAATPAEGLAIAIYGDPARGYGVVDDRRVVEVAGGTLVLDRIDPAAPLHTLLIEPLRAGDALRVTSCVRERIDDSAAALAQLAAARGERPRRVIVMHDPEDAPEQFELRDSDEMEPAIMPDPSVLSPLVKCRVDARPGQHLVRVLHVTSALRFRSQHDVAMTAAEHATVATRFAIDTPAWGAARAEVVLYEGIPGGAAPPNELARGPIRLDGSTAILATPPRELAARLRSIYDGTKLEDSHDVKPSDIVWGRESRHQVWVWLELTGRIPHGPVRAHVELPGQPARDIALAADVRDATSEHARFPLWIDEELLGTRRRSIERADGVIITDRVQLAVANLGGAPREVWVEERLRTARRRSLVHAWPNRPALAGDVARTKLTLAPGETARLGFTIDYEF